MPKMDLEEWKKYRDYCVYEDLTSGPEEERAAKIHRLHGPLLDNNPIAQVFREMFPLPVEAS